MYIPSTVTLKTVDHTPKKVSPVSFLEPRNSFTLLLAGLPLEQFQGTWRTALLFNIGIFAGPEALRIDDFAGQRDPVIQADVVWERGNIPAKMVHSFLVNDTMIQWYSFFLRM